MVWYVALVAIANLGLGYALAVYVGTGRSAEPESASEEYDSELTDSELIEE